MSILTQSTEALCGTSLHLIQGLELRCDDEPVLLPEAAQRLVAYLALKRRPSAASPSPGCSGWIRPTSRRPRTCARCSGAPAGSIPTLSCPTAATSASATTSTSDLHEMVAAVHALVDDPSPPVLPETSAKLLCEDLLPDWCDDWGRARARAAPPGPAPRPRGAVPPADGARPVSPRHFSPPSRPVSSPRRPIRSVRAPSERS